MIAHVEPPDFYHHRSLLGTVRCDTCHREWPCHLSAWITAHHVFSCVVSGCGGTVAWVEGAA